MPCRRAVLGLGAVALGAGARGKARRGRSPEPAKPAAPRGAGRPLFHERGRQTGLPRRHPHLAGLAGPRPGLRLARFPRAPGADRRQFHPHVGDRRRGRPQRARPDPPSPLRQDRRRPLRSRQVRRCLLRPDTRARDRGRPARHVCQPDAVQRLGSPVRGAAESLPRLALEGRQQRERHQRRPARNTGIGRDVQTLNDPAITAIQENYVRRVVDALDDLPNVLFEISNETASTEEGWAWQHHMLAVVKRHDALRGGFRHPVGLTAAAAAWIGDEAGINDRLAGSDADWFSPTGSTYQSDPPPASGAKVSIVDTDHLWGIGGQSVDWVWRTFTRGHNLLSMDSLRGPDLAGRSVRYDADSPREQRRRRRRRRGKASGRPAPFPEMVDLRGMRSRARAFFHRLRAGGPGGRRFRRLRAGRRRLHARPVRGRRREPAQGWVGGRGGRHGGRERCGGGRQRRAIRAALRGKARRPGAAARRGGHHHASVNRRDEHRSPASYAGFGRCGRHERRRDLPLRR